MKIANKLNFIAMCERALEASNWTEYDRAYVVDNSHVVCFRSTARTDESKSLLRAAIDVVSRVRSAENNRNRSSIVVFEEKDAPGAASIVGVIEANPKELERQYNHIRNILKPMGLCEGYGKRLFLDEIPSAKITITTKSSESTSRSLIQKSAASLGGLFKSFNLNVESALSRESKTGKESALEKKTEVDAGAVRSALLINMISQDMGVSSLESIMAMDSCLASYEDIGSTESLHFLGRDIQNYEHKVDVATEALISNIKNAYTTLNAKVARASYDDERSQYASIAMENLGKAAEDISNGKVEGKTFDRLFRANDIIQNQLSEQTLSGAVDYCMHGTILLVCLAHTKDKLAAAHENMKQRALEGDLSIVSSSLGFQSYVSRQNESKTLQNQGFVRRP